MACYEGPNYGGREDKPMPVPSAAYAEFMTNKPNPPEHTAFMALAAKLYPKLPPGAQQNALDCLERHGKGYAKRYAANALARESANQRHTMGCTLATWRTKRADDVKPYHFEGVISEKRRREYKAMAERLAAYRAAQYDQHVQLLWAHCEAQVSRANAEFRRRGSYMRAYPNAA